MDTQLYLERIVELFEEELKENLLGIYLLLVVIKDNLRTHINKRIAKIVGL
jgi:hypothetical protein